MTKYPVRCNDSKCNHEFSVDVSPPPYAKPRTKPEDIEPAGILTSTTGIDAICPKCGHKGAKSY